MIAFLAVSADCFFNNLHRNLFIFLTDYISQTILGLITKIHYGERQMMCIASVIGSHLYSYLVNEIRTYVKHTYISSSFII